MVLVFILLSIIILMIASFLLIILSTLHIEIKNFSATNMEKNKKTKNYEIIFSLYFKNYIKWLSFHFNDKKAKKVYSKIQLEKLDLKKVKSDFKLIGLEKIKKLKPKLSYLDLKLLIGLTNPISTSFLVAIISSTISIILPYLAKKIKSQKYKYEVNPIYYNNNLYKIDLNCIIEIKMVHIINIIYLYIKKGKSDNNERSTSNRKSYAYSYE